MSKQENQPGSWGMKYVAQMEQITIDRIGKRGISNAQENLKYLKLGKSLKELPAAIGTEKNAALVIAAGPSIKRHNIMRRLKSSGFKGLIIATESALQYCLTEDIVPNLIVTLDPHDKRIVRWFGDPELNETDISRDDYFSRQDMDTSFADELQMNQRMVDLVNRYGKQMRIALSTSSSERVVKRVLDTGMQIYWWNPMYDNPDLPNSLTRNLYDLNGLPSVNAGGNVGSASWMMAHAVLNRRHVGLAGFDFSYYPDTPYRNTQYYYEAVNLVGQEHLDKFFIPVYNPHLRLSFYTDPAYMWYREIFLEMAKDADCETYNCTEGGILFGKPIKFFSLDKFIDSYGRLNG